jgi:hypothetical protein
MSKDFPQFNEDEAVKAEDSAKPKRPIVSRTRKAASAGKPKKSDEPQLKPAEVLKAPVAEAMVTVVENEVPSKPEPEWADAAPESVGGTTQGAEGGGSNKRKRRRRKGKGGGSSAPVEGMDAPSPAPVPSSSAPQPAKSRINPEFLAKSAWKIYLAEVSEEGVALVGDQDARELARRCFRLAEIFLEEQGRRSGM